MESVSLLGIVRGAVLTLGAIVLGYQPSSPIAAGVFIFLVLVVALTGLKPFGDMVAHALLQATVFAAWALIELFIGNTNVILMILAVGGFISVLRHGRYVMHQGLWEIR